MRRVLVVGCGGSGKTQLAKRLAARCDLPLTHLDAEFYDAEWNALPQKEFAARQRTLVSAPRWLIDGNYASTEPFQSGLCKGSVDSASPAQVSQVTP